MTYFNIPTVDRAIAAYDLGHSSVLWKFQMADPNANGDRYLYAGQIAFSQGVVFATSGETGIFALDSRTGKLLWSLAMPWVQIETPAIDDGLVFVSGKSREAPFAGEIYALDERTGAAKWVFSEGEVSIASSAVAVGDGVVYAGGSDHVLRAIDANSGQEIWTFKAAAVITQPPTITDDVVYITANDRTLYAVRLSDGMELWRLAIPSVFMDGPVPSGDFLYGTTGDGFLVVIGLPAQATPGSAGT